MKIAISYDWNNLMRRLDCPPSLSNEVFALIIDCYASVGRYYHGLGHLAVCLSELAAVRHYLENREAVELALWFHDSVYVSSSHYNEELSAAVGYHYAWILTQNKGLAVQVYKMIMATKHQLSSGLDNDTQYLLDIDLAVLGYPWADFLDYSDGIRREYSHLSEAEYQQGRRQVLRAFLAREFIYHTEYFRGKYEQQARLNLRGVLN